MRVLVFVDLIYSLFKQITHHLLAFGIEHKKLIITAGFATFINRSVICVSNKNSIVAVVISDFVNIRCDVIHINFDAIKVRVGFLKKRKEIQDFWVCLISPVETSGRMRTHTVYCSFASFPHYQSDKFIVFMENAYI